MRKLFVALVGIAMSIALVAMTRPMVAIAMQAQADSTATVTLSGGEEVPSPGDSDGAGRTTITFKSGSGEVCWDISVSNITLPSVGAHIHEGAKGAAGPVVVPFSPPDANGKASGCTTPEAAVVTRIMEHPENFYVNIHTSDFPAGAVRGQLMMVTGSTVPPSLPETGASPMWLSALAGCALLAGALGFSLHHRARPNTKHH